MTYSVDMCYEMMREMINIYDLNDYPNSLKNADYGGMAGSKDGILIDGEEWMIKYPKHLSDMAGNGLAFYSTSPLSEYLGSHIYEILGYDVHETILGERNGKLVVGCKDFAPFDSGKKLLEIRTIKNHTGRELSDLLETKHYRSSQTHIVDLDELLLHIRKNPVLSVVDGIEERFFEQSIIDIFINNNDRNNGNWGIIRSSDRNDILAPIFDNGGSFSTKASDERLEKLLANPNFESNTMNSLTAYGNEKHQYPAKEFLKKMENEPIMQQSLVKVVPLIEKSLPQIQKMFAEIPNETVSRDGKVLSVCSEVRKTCYLEQAKIRLKKILEPAYRDALLKQEKVNSQSI